MPVTLADPLTKAQIRAAVRVELNEPVPGFWADADLDRWAQDGYNELVMHARMEGGPVSFVTVAGTDTVAFVNGDEGQIARVEREISAGSGLYQECIPTVLSDKKSYKGTPGKWFVFNEQLTLVPIPDTSGLNMRYYYYKRAPKLVNESDTPILRVEYHRGIVFYATARAKQRGDDPAFATYDALYESIRQSMEQELFHREQQARFPVVKDDWSDTR